MAAVRVQGHVINDGIRKQAIEGDGAGLNSSFGIWKAITNILINGGFESNITGWNKGGTNTIAISTDQKKFGAQSMKCTYLDNDVLCFHPRTLTAVQHIASMWVYIPSDYDGTDLRMSAGDYASATGDLEESLDMTKVDQWQKVFHIFTPDAGDLSGSICVLTEEGTNPTGGKFVYVDGCQIRIDSIIHPVDNPYIETDGATASEAASRITAPTSLLGPEIWIATRVRPHWPESAFASSTPRIFSCRNDATHYIELFFFDIGNGITIIRQNGAGSDIVTKTISWSKDQELIVIAKSLSDKVSIAVDGEAFADVSGTQVPALDVPEFDIGSSQGDDIQPMQGDIIWFMTGIGDLTDIDSATLDALGNTAPTFDTLPFGAKVTMIWDASTTEYEVPEPVIHASKKAVTTVIFRNPFPPHEALAYVEADELSFGHMLMDIGTASFKVKRGNAALRALTYQFGAMITIERDDGSYPYVGMVTNRKISSGGGYINFECKDHAGALYDRAVIPEEFARELFDEGDIKEAEVFIDSGPAYQIRLILEHIDAENAPPLLSTLDLDEGAEIDTVFVPESTTALDYLQSMNELTDWEWGFVSDVGIHGVETKLIWRERISRDLRDHEVWQEFNHFVEFEYEQDAEAFIEKAIVIAPPQDSDDDLQRITVDCGRSNLPPALKGAHAEVELETSDLATLEKKANRMCADPTNRGEHVTMTVISDKVSPGVPIPGDYIRIKFDDDGKAQNRVMRVMGAQHDSGTGLIVVEAELEPTEDSGFADV